jgi:hypothetical protein
MNKLGASPNWNDGIMGSIIIQLRVNGKFCVDDKIKNG